MAKLVTGTNLTALLAAMTFALGGACTVEKTDTDTVDDGGTSSIEDGGEANSTGGARPNGGSTQSDAGEPSEADGGEPEAATGGTGGEITRATGGTATGGTAAGGTAGSAGANDDPTSPEDLARCATLNFMEGAAGAAGSDPGAVCTYTFEEAGGAGGAAGVEVDYMTRAENYCNELAVRGRKEVFEVLYTCLDTQVTRANMCPATPDDMDNDPGWFCLDLALTAGSLTPPAELVPGSDYSCQDLVDGCVDEQDPVTLDECNRWLSGFGPEARANIIYCYECGDPLMLDESLSCRDMFTECLFPSLPEVTSPYPYPGTCVDAAGGAGGAGGSGG